MNAFHLPSYRDMLSKLISIPSVSSGTARWDQSNLGVIHLLSEWLEGLGFAIEIMSLSDTKANLIATRGKGDGGLVLSGHTDTVPFDDARWKTDPFILTERDNKFFGLGSCDMKGFFPVVLSAIQSFAGALPEEPLIVLATADEESSMSGAKALAAAGQLKGRCALIGEPTNLKPIRMHKGIMMESLRITGRSGHSSNPALGNNALECMQDVMGGLLVFRKELQRRNRNDAFTVNVPTLNLAHIHGGDNPNRICGECELHFDVRPLPGMSISALHEQLERWVLPFAQQYGTEILLNKMSGGAEAFQNEANSEMVKLCERLSGQGSGSVAFATEAPYLSSLGLDTVIMGPGSIDQAHQPDEYIDTRQIQPAINIIRQLIQKYCF